MTHEDLVTRVARGIDAYHNPYAKPSATRHMLHAGAARAALRAVAEAAGGADMAGAVADYIDHERETFADDQAQAAWREFATLLRALAEAHDGAAALRAREAGRG